MAKNKKPSNAETAATQGKAVDQTAEIPQSKVVLSEEQIEALRDLTLVAFFTHFGMDKNTGVYTPEHGASAFDNTDWTKNPAKIIEKILKGENNKRLTIFTDNQQLIEQLRSRRFKEISHGAEHIGILDSSHHLFAIDFNNKDHYENFCRLVMERVAGKRMTRAVDEIRGMTDDIKKFQAGCKKAHDEVTGFFDEVSELFDVSAMAEKEKGRKELQKRIATLTDGRSLP